MLSTQTGTLTRPTHRLLDASPPYRTLIRPAAQLWRLRPVRLGRVTRDLRNLERTAKALKLIQTYFPEEFSGYYQTCRPLTNWYGLLADITGMLTEADWFEVDVDTLDYFHEIYMNEDFDEREEDEESILGDMARYLDYLPVKVYNWGLEGWHNQVAEEYPQLCLIRGLTDPSFEKSISGLLIEYELYDNLEGVDIWAGLEAISPETHEEPLCWLPEVARFCCRQTGNLLLDSDTEDWEYWIFRWEELEEVKRLSQEARPIWEHIRKFLLWANDQRAMELIFYALVGEEVEDNDQEED